VKPLFKTPSQDKNKYHDVDTVVLDVSWMAKRHANALGKRFLTSDGRMSGHVYGAFKDVKSLLGSLRPRRLAFAYDRGYQWRLDLLPDYKASRRPVSGTLDAFSPTPDLERMFRTFPGLHLSYDDAEADDMAAWMALNHERSGALVIYSKDKDLWQLVSDADEVACMFPHKAEPRAKSQRLWVREAIVEKDFGVKPQHLAKLKALAGDTSDMIKGLTGGKKSGKKEAVKAFAMDSSSDDYFNPEVANPKINAADFLVQPLMDERDRLLANFQVTSLPNAVKRITTEPIEKTEADLAGALGIMAEFECDSLMAQVEPLFKELTAP